MNLLTLNIRLAGITRRCKKFIFFTILLAAFSISTTAQHENTQWTFGGLDALNFLTSPPTPVLTSSLFSNWACATAADGAGNMLMCSNGEEIRNQQNVIMANGSGLNGSNYTTQGVLIVKQPGNTTIYFVFTLGPFGLRYSTVDMSLAAGMGSVTAKNKQLAVTCTEQLAGVRHCNGTDVWVVAHDLASTTFKAFLVTASGVNLLPVTSSSGPLPPPLKNSNPTKTIGQGTFKFSPDGNKLGMTLWQDFPFDGYIGVLDFNRTTGVVSNYQNFIYGAHTFYGCEFSPDGSKFYGASLKNIYQWDLCAGTPGAVIASSIVVATTFIPHYQLQLATDKKIYLAGGDYSLSVINNPNSAGTLCNFTYMSQNVGKNMTNQGLPNFIAGIGKELPPVTATVGCASATIATSNSVFNSGCAMQGNPVTKILWDFGDPQSGTTNTSTALTTSHQYPATGSYMAKLIITYQCGTDTVYHPLAIHLPTVSVTASTLQTCVGHSLTLYSQSGGGTGNYMYNWAGGPSSATFVTTQQMPGPVMYKINIVDGEGCTASDSIMVGYLPNPDVSVMSASICEGDPVKLIAVGASSYLWQPGNLTGNSVTLTPGTSQQYTVTGTDSYGCIDTDQVSVWVLTCLSANEQISGQHLPVAFPNPVKDELRVEVFSRCRIVVMDLHGRIVVSQDAQPGITQLSTRELMAGSYFLKVYNEQSCYYLKLLVEN